MISLRVRDGFNGFIRCLLREHGTKSLEPEQMTGKDYKHTPRTGCSERKENSASELCRRHTFQLACHVYVWCLLGTGVSRRLQALCCDIPFQDVS